MVINQRHPADHTLGEPQRLAESCNLVELRQKMEFSDEADWLEDESIDAQQSVVNKIQKGLQVVLDHIFVRSTRSRIYTSISISKSTFVEKHL